MDQAISSLDCDLSRYFFDAAEQHRLFDDHRCRDCLFFDSSHPLQCLVLLRLTSDPYLHAGPPDSICHWCFCGPSLYCFLVLRHVGFSQTEVPHLSVSLGIVFAVLNFGVLIYFVHHVAIAIQAAQVIQSLSRELNLSIESLFPEKLGQSGEALEEDRPSLEEFNDHVATEILANREGYLQVIDTERLLDLANKYDVVILVERRPGDFITREQPVFSVTGLEEVTLNLVEEFNETLFVGSRRTPRQDVECAVHELVEVAVRALSPGINDPFTAITCLDYLSASLVKLSQREIPSAYRYDENQKLRVISYPFTFNGVLDSSLNQIRQFGSGSAAVLIRIIERLTLMATCVTRESDQEGLMKHAEMVLREAKRSLPEPEDLKIVEIRYDDFQKAISGDRSVEFEITLDEE